MRKFIGIILISILAMGLGCKKEARVIPPVEVEVGHPSVIGEDKNLQFSGITSSLQAVDVSADVEGKVAKINFTSGQLVQAGDILIELDAQDIPAQLEKATAKWKYYNDLAARYEKLFKTNIISAADMSQFRWQEQQALADIHIAQLQLEQYKVRAPFAGKIGIKQIEVGEHVRAGQLLATLDNTISLYVDFEIPERYAALVHKDQIIFLWSDILPDKKWQAKITALDSRVQHETHVLHVQAILNNSDQVLYAGLYVHIKLILPSVNHSVFIPQSALVFSPQGTFVYLIKNHLAILQSINIQSLLTDTAEISSGIVPTDWVVLKGQNNLFDHAPIKIVN